MKLERASLTSLAASTADPCGPNGVSIRDEGYLASKRRPTRRLVPTVLCVFCSLFPLASTACGGDDPATDAADDEVTNGENAKNGDGKGEGKKKEQEIKTQGQALRALLDFSQTQVDEAKVGAEKTKSDDVRALAEGIAADSATAIERLNAISSDKGITPAKNGLGDRLLFNSKSQISHIANVMPGMVDNAYITRVQNAQKEIVTQIDEAITPVLEDEDFKAEVAVIREDATRHLADANTVADAVKGGETGLPPLGPGGGSPFGDGGAGNGGGPAPAVGPNGEQVPELNPNQMPGGAGAPGGGLPGGNLNGGGGNLDGGV